MTITIDGEEERQIKKKLIKRGNLLIDKLEEMGIQEGDTVRMYGLEVDYYK